MDSSIFYNDVETWVDTRGYQLSDRIWTNKQRARQYIDDAIRRGIEDGATIEEVANELVTWIRPSFGPYGGGKAQYSAQRLAGNEMRRAHSLGARETSLADPAGGFLRFRNSRHHAHVDTCTEIANDDEGYGRGIYPAAECELPPIHVGCECNVEQVTGVNRDEMADFVEQLRVEYGLADPPDLSPDELAIFRAETAQIREDVQVMFQGWFEQTGLVSRESLMESSPTVREWVESVQAEKRRRKP